MTTAIEFNNVSVRYDNLLALDEVNLIVPEYEFLGIIGPNGGGKTTLLKLLTGLLKPTIGELKIYGKDINKMRSILGYVPQFTSFDNTYPISVYDVVKMGRLGKRADVRFTASSYSVHLATWIKSNSKGKWEVFIKHVNGQCG